MFKRDKTIQSRHPRLLAMRRKGQNMVEFAFISMILFATVLGILEGGRLMFIFSQVASAAQEGARYGAVHPREIITAADDGANSYPSGRVPGGAHWDAPCTVVDQARARVVLLDQRAVNVEVSYDDGSSPKDPWNDGWMPGQDRIIVRAWYPFHFLLGLFDRLLPASGLTVEMVSARTIMVDEVSAPPSGQCSYHP